MCLCGEGGLDTAGRYGMHMRMHGPALPARAPGAVCLVLKASYVLDVGVFLMSVCAETVFSLRVPLFTWLHSNVS